MVLFRFRETKGGFGFDRNQFWVSVGRTLRGRALRGRTLRGRALRGRALRGRTLPYCFDSLFIFDLNTSFIVDFQQSKLQKILIKHKNFHE